MDKFKFTKPCHMINYLLFEDYDNSSEGKNCPWSFYIHAYIMEKWEKFFHNWLPHIEWEIYEQILQNGTETYDVCLIILTRATENQIIFLHHSIINSQFSFPWEDNPTIFIDASSFNVVQKFITVHKLKGYILKIEEHLGVTGNDKIIKVITFNQSVNAQLVLITEFKKCLESGLGLKYYFMIKAFPWQQSKWLRNIHINDAIYSIFPIILNHLGGLNYTDDLNIMDLISLRLALSDVRRDMFQSTLVKYEIDFMIKRELSKIVQNNHLDLHNYLIDENMKADGLLMYYLVYEFQNFFETVNIAGIDVCDKPMKVIGDILLVEESDVLNKLKKTFNTNFYIDGTDFDQMNLSLFFGLTDCHNVNQIDLDTNQKWLPNLSKLDQSISTNKKDIVDVLLIGVNRYNFIEDFIGELKSITFEYSPIGLSLSYNLNDYRIFDKLKLSYLYIYSIKIDANMLENLHQCEKKPLISLFDCSFANICHNWELLNSLGKLDEVNINEDEGTWQSLFVFVSGEMFKSNTKEFKFNTKSRKILVKTTGNFINLGKIKFTLDEQNSKLEIHDTDNKIIDLFYDKFSIQPDEKFDYEFYE